MVKSKEVAKVNDTKVIDHNNITAEDVKKFFCATATDKELIMFLQIAKMNKLNPFKREIYLVKYGSYPASVLTGYEVYLKRAERSGNYAGFKVWIEDNDEGNLKACIEVYRKDWEKPLYHEVDFDEYAQRKSNGELNKFWKDKPKTMIKKVVISQGLRFAFPDELAGMPYVREEMDIEERIDVKPEIKEPEALKKEPEPAQDDVGNDLSPEPKVNPPKKEKLEIPPPEPQKEPKKVKTLKERFAYAYEKLGAQEYLAILKTFGVSKTSEIKSKEVAEKVLTSLEDAVIIKDPSAGDWNV